MSTMTADAAPSMEWIEHIPYRLDAGLAGRARIGLVVLASDHTVEYEFRRIMDMPGVSFYGARIPNSPEITPENLAAMEAHISDTARLILPGEDLDVVAYGCTSASMVLGEEAVFKRLREGRPEAKPTTPITAAFAAFDAFGAKRIAVVTPYPRSVNITVRDYIVGAGYDVPVFGSFNDDNDNSVARISSDSLRDAILAVGRRDDVDMVFLSCTSLRLVDAARDIEAALGKPVTASNHAMAWHCLRLAGVDDKKPEFGRLYEV
jgi:maleate isomerase